MKRTILKMITAFALIIAMAAGMSTGYVRKAEAGSNTYTVKFYSNGGTITFNGSTYSTLTLYRGKNALIPCPSASKAGYKFLGYNTSSSAKTAKYKAGQNITVTGNMTLYAVYQVLPITVVYSVKSSNWFVDEDEMPVTGSYTNYLAQYDRSRYSACTIANMPKIQAYGIHPKYTVGCWVPVVDGKTYYNCEISNLSRVNIQTILNTIGKPYSTNIMFWQLY